MTERFSPQLLRGSLDLMVLSILADEPTYGYRIQQRLKEVSRAFTHQLVRHRLCSFSQQSQRYVREDNFSYKIPPKIEVKKEAKEIFVKCMENMREAYKKILDMDIP